MENYINECAHSCKKNKLEEGEKIVQIMQITVYVNSEPDFTKQPKIADFASEYFCEELGESGVGSRAAVGFGFFRVARRGVQGMVGDEE